MPSDASEKLQFVKIITTVILWDTEREKSFP
jgi:hypothetical protein